MSKANKNKKHKKHKARFFEKLCFKYRIFVLNENTLEKELSFRLSLLNLILLISFSFILFFIIISALILKTPLNTYLPGYVDVEIRKEVAENIMIVDSLSYEIEEKNIYLNTIKMALSGELSLDTFDITDSSDRKKLEQIVSEKSEREKLFCEKFEADEKYNLSVFDELLNNEKLDYIVFMKPVKGTIIEQFDLSQKHVGVDISVQPNETVVSTYDGTVIFDGFTISDGYIIQIQHPNNYISIYKNISRIVKQQGDLVKAGEVIGRIENDKDSFSGSSLHFELWKDGKAVDPQIYIIF